MLVAAEFVGLGGREPPQVVERQAAANVAAEFGGHGVGDPHELVEVEVAAMAGERPGDRERQPEEFVEVEMRRIVAQRIPAGVAMARPVEREPAA